MHASERKITFAPHVFQLPDCYPELDLVSVMMPFDASFNSVHAAIKAAFPVVLRPKP